MFVVQDAKKIFVIFSAIFTIWRPEMVLSDAKKCPNMAVSKNGAYRQCFSRYLPNFKFGLQYWYVPMLRRVNLEMAVPEIQIWRSQTGSRFKF
jgi:hypothetical protein